MYTYLLCIYLHAYILRYILICINYDVFMYFNDVFQKPTYRQEKHITVN